MRAFAALVFREISERRALLGAAAVASVLPVLAPLLPATGGNPAADVRVAVMWIMVGLLVPLFALLLGVSFIGRDLSEGRLGFYFAQPLSGPTIWFGKLAAVVLLIWGAQVLMMLPTVLLSPDAAQLLAPTDLFELPYEFSFLQPYTALPLWLVPLGIVLLSHAVSVVWRGRSVWLVVDFVALLVVAGGTWMALRPFLSFPDQDSLSEWVASQWWGLRVLISSVAPGTALAGLLWIAAAVLIALIVAGAAQLTFGRVDLRRAHRSLSTVLWGVLAVAVGALLGWSSWVRSATPEDLLGVDTVLVASGDWIAVGGQSSGRFDYHPRFFLNAVDGRWLRIDSVGGWGSRNLRFSGDGLHAFWTTRSQSDERSMMYVNLNDKDPGVRSSGLVLRQDDSSFNVTHEGDRIAIIEERTTAVYDVETGDQLAAVVINGEFEPNYCWFEGPGTVVISASTPWVWEGFEAEYRSTTFRFDVVSRKLTRGEVVEETTAGRGTAETLVAQDRRRLERVEKDTGDTLALVDAESGEVVADLGGIQSFWEVRDAGNGRFFVLGESDDESFMDYFDAGGVRLNKVEYGPDSWLRFAGEVAPGRLMLGIELSNSDEPEIERYRFSIVNTETGLVETTVNGFYPLQGRPWRGIESVGYGAWQVGSVSSRLLQADDGSLHLWDPETGKLKQLIPAVG